MAYPGLARIDHRYIGREHCTGYTDVDGKWNTGFYCPQYGSKTAVFCCGTAVFKYCCTNQEPVDPNSSSSGVLLDGDDPNFDGSSHNGVSSAVFVRVPIVFVVVCGIAAVLVLLIVAACYFCSCCFAYKKRRNEQSHSDLPRRMNRLHINPPIMPQAPTLSAPGLYRNSAPSMSSTTASSNLLNLYSGITTTGPLINNSLTATPLDLDWGSSITPTYQPQPQQMFQPPSLQYAPPPQGPGTVLTPAAAATLAVALSQQQRVNFQPNVSSSSHLAGGSAPSIISGTTLSTSTGRLPSVSQAYQSFLNSSTSTLSSSTTPVPPRGLAPQQSQFHRTNHPEQISTTASLVNSYLASLQQAQQVQSHSEHPPPVVPASLPSMERTRHPSPPPSYFQTVSSSYHGGSSSTNSNSNNNYINNNNRNSRTGNQNNQRQNRMATIQSILGGYGTSYSGGTTWNNEDDLLLADFLLRHENTLRRSLGLSNNVNNSNHRTSNNNVNNINNTHSNSSTSTTNTNSRNRGNPMLTQRELIELLLRLTHHGNSGNNATTLHSSASTGSSISRSESRAGSDSHSTTSSVATTRSTSSAVSNTSNGKVNGSVHGTQNCTKLTICEVDEDDAVVAGQDGCTGGSGTGPDVTMRNSKKACLDLSLSRLSVGENDSGVASSTCSTVGSEVADSVIGSIKMISRDLSEEALKLKKQPHAVDDDGVQDVKVVEENLTISKKIKEKLQEQQLAATIHSERICGDASDANESTSTNNNGRDRGDVGFKRNNSVACIETRSGKEEEIIEMVENQDRNGNSGCIPPCSTALVSTVSVPAAISPGSPPGGILVTTCENTISTTKSITVPHV